MRFATITLTILVAATASAANLPSAERTAVEFTVRTEVTKDLSVPYLPNQSDRPGITGQSFINGTNLVEYWADMECAYCSPAQPVAAARRNPELHIIVRHMPAQGQESVKKALVYEALKHFSTNAANMFWEAVVPKTTLAMPVPYTASMHEALFAAGIDPEVFEEYLAQNATQTLQEDLEAAQGRITWTPTYVIQGVRFLGCDFAPDELLTALELVHKARAGDDQAKEEIIGIIVREQLGEPEA